MTEYLTEQELEGVRKIREVMGGSIPQDLDTEFNLRRWWNGHHQDLTVIKEKFSSYLHNRRLMGFERPDFADTFYQREEFMEIVQYFGMSRISEDCVSSDNAVVFVESGEFDHKVVYVSTISKYLRVFFACCELVLQTILRIEKKTGRPSYGLCIFDMGRLSLANHINPMSSCNQVFKVRALIWEDNYPDMIQKIVVVNPPYFIGIIWKVVKFLLKEKQQKLLYFNKGTSLFDFVDRDVVPVAYGGNRKDPLWSNNDDCCNDKKLITEDDYYQHGLIWNLIDIQEPDFVHISVKAHKRCLIRCTPQNTQKGRFVAWRFSLSDQAEFTVYRGKEQVYPRMRLVTTEVDDEDLIHCSEDDDSEYFLEFTNNNRFLALSIKIALFTGSPLITDTDLPPAS
uniref:CRAL-TRIO domain-containing protein n=1 Tax=Acrobeloides nanus TaxID=290746 RepID=A0A914E7D2_9BILA